MQYLADDDTFVVVASNAGAARPPAWYLNLRANPHAQIDVGGRSVDVRAQEATGQERAELWQRLTAANRYLERAAARPDASCPSWPSCPRRRRPAASRRPLVTTTPVPTRRFTSDMLAGLDEPVRRYFSHAIGDGAALPNGVRMAMSGRIKVGLWLPFTAEQTVDGRSFTWRARVGRGPLTPLRVTDRYADAAGSTEGRLLGRVTLFHAHDANTARSAATRAAIESVVFAPPSVLPDRGVTWRAETDNVIVARFDLPPEQPEVRLRIDEHGAIRTVSAQRWGNAGEKTFQYIPFGGQIHAERRFGDLLLPSTLQRRLVVRHSALRPVLSCRDQRGHANALGGGPHAAEVVVAARRAGIVPRDDVRHGTRSGPRRVPAGPRSTCTGCRSAPVATSCDSTVACSRRWRRALRGDRRATCTTRRSKSVSRRRGS